MCSPTTCRSCSKTTWAGCGRHVDQVMGRVPQAKRCDCGDAHAGSRDSLLSRILGR